MSTSGEKDSLRFPCPLALGDGEQSRILCRRNKTGIGCIGYFGVIVYE